MTEIWKFPQACGSYSSSLLSMHDEGTSLISLIAIQLSKHPVDCGFLGIPQFKLNFHRTNNLTSAAASRPRPIRVLPAAGLHALPPVRPRRGVTLGFPCRHGRAATSARWRHPARPAAGGPPGRPRAARSCLVLVVLHEAAATGHAGQALGLLPRRPPLLRSP